MTKKKGKPSPSLSEEAGNNLPVKSQPGVRPKLVRDHTVRFTSWSIVDGDVFHNLVYDHLNDLRCVQVIDGRTFDVTFCSVASAQKIVASPTCDMGCSTFLVSPVDQPRQMIKVQGLPFEISQADVIDVLSDYGEVFGGERLKYKGRPYDSGDRVFIMYLETNIPRYIEVLGYEGVVFHRKQDLSCNYCHKSGHVRQRCPDLVCRICGDCGHFSYSCPRRICKKCHGMGHWARECHVHQVPVPPPVSSVPVSAACRETPTPSVPVSAAPRESVIKKPRLDPPAASKPVDCPPKPITVVSPPVDTDPFSDNYEQPMDDVPELPTPESMRSHPKETEARLKQMSHAELLILKDRLEANRAKT